MSTVTLPAGITRAGLSSDPKEIVTFLREKATHIRRNALSMAFEAQLGHPGGDMSVTDILATLFFGVMRYDPKEPDAPERDRFVMSKGHCTGAFYAALAEAGYFPHAELSTYMGPLSRLNGHPNRNYLPGVETNTGPLGHGMPVAVGMAIAARLDGSDRRVFVVTGDGEQQEGSNWEAGMLAGHRRLDNLTLIIDRNRLQQGARVEETNTLEPLADKWRAFGWEVRECDGHDHAALLEHLAAPSAGKPRCIIAHTIKGKGVSFMEDEVHWHHGVLNRNQYDQAIGELSDERAG
ncbi:transketolase [Martelella radicis]|uniref:Transketolase n=1 Tax=Martelella radicis TaxID=1397476 RepID=A0A7W6PDJ4_9HYPH|nr:transketolase [Martelella radicis]MBB4124527.1 transketolase [Martelella radicis]